jgi:hypothetical protein
MKKQIIRLLSILGFLLLFAPMFQQCVGVMKEVSVEESAIDIKVSEFKESTDSISIQSSEDVFKGVSKHEKVADFFKIFDSSESTNAFEYTKLFYDFNIDLLFKNETFSKKDLLIYLQTFMISLLVLNQILIVFLSFFEKINKLKKLIITNIIFLFIGLLCFILQSTFETYMQIKYGFYLLVMHQIYFLFYLKRNYK